MKTVRGHDSHDSGFPFDEIFPFDPAAIGLDETPPRSPITEWCGNLFERLDPKEAEVVRHFRAEGPVAHAAAKFFNDFGAGWIYPILALIAIVIDGSLALLPTGCAALAIAVAQSSFPFIKKLVKRERPLAFDPSLENGVRPLDRWAWPSGHSIAAAAFATPFLLAGLASSTLIAICAGGVFWSRVALGHHYPTDVLGGITMGAAVGTICWMLVL